MILPTQKVTREQTKLHNSRLVLNTIFDHEPVSRADIARLTGLTATTVSNVAAELLENGLVEEETLSTNLFRSIAKLILWRHYQFARGNLKSGKRTGSETERRCRLVLDI